MVYWLSQLRRMVSSSHESILECVKAGILVVLRDSMLDDEGNSRDAEWMAPAADFIRYVLTPAFVWPDVLHTLRQAIKERHISWDVERIRPLCVLNESNPAHAVCVRAVKSSTVPGLAREHIGGAGIALNVAPETKLNISSSRTRVS
ncbi:hypothetical protein BD626DRAFT_575234 [Schizophyllum amplum]|uniref:Uncharacterized protein n=1 Tax=Schizophyllum amplum TaxID=97359 RepID=A0A550BW94_9AGAR|nr:hypothetical protein BD626DRAFT_575234 [Auriculariopsis ampla]